SRDASWSAPADSLRHAIAKDAKGALDPGREWICDERRVAGGRNGAGIIDPSLQGGEELRVVQLLLRGGSLERFSDHIGCRDLGSEQNAGNSGHLGLLPVVCPRPSKGG